MRMRPPEAPNNQRREGQPYPPPNRRPALRRGVVKPETPSGCAYYLLLFTWCGAAFVRHMDPAGRAGSTWNTATGIMFAVGVGLVVAGLWTLIFPPRDRLQGGWITVVGGLAVSGALWGLW
jgi:protein-S-isoprenylcysteine O-methyltransferase Ste14